MSRLHTGMRRAIAASIALLTATVLWSVLAVVEASPWAADSAGVLGATLVVLAAAAIVGMLVGASRWARKLGISVTLAGAAMGIALPFGAAWVVAIVTSSLALFGLAGNATLGVVRKLPAAVGPSPRVVAFTIGLVSIPGVVAAASPSGLGGPEWLVIGGGAVTAGLYAKAAPFALTTVRLAFPALAVAAAAWRALPAGLVLAAVGVAVAAFGWTKPARVAVRPLVETARTVPMLPEMVPADVRETAGIDEKGRPLG